MRIYSVVCAPYGKVLRGFVFSDKTHNRIHTLSAELIGRDIIASVNGEVWSSSCSRIDSGNATTRIAFNVKRSHETAIQISWEELREVQALKSTRAECVDNACESMPVKRRA